MNGSEATARIIPALQVRVEGGLRVIETNLQPVKPRDAIAALLTAHCPEATPDVWAVRVERVNATDWLLTAGRDRVHVSAYTVESTDETIVYILTPRQCFALRKDPSITDDEIHDEMGRQSWRLAATIGAWYRWLMTEVE